jgi:hypothetical protein
MRALIIATLFLASCGGETIRPNLPPPPRDYMVCAKLPERPDLKPLEAITLDDGRVVYLKAETDARDAQVARYLVAVRDSWFSCSNQLGKVADYYKGE